MYEHIWEKDQFRNIHMGTTMDPLLPINVLSKQNSNKWPGEPVPWLLEQGIENNLRSHQPSFN